MQDQPIFIGNVEIDSQKLLIQSFSRWVILHISQEETLLHNWPYLETYLTQAYSEVYWYQLFGGN